MKILWICLIFLNPYLYAQTQYSTVLLQGRAKHLYSKDSLGASLLKIHLIDIGQGDSMLLQMPNQKSVLIDTGPSSAKERLVNYLKAQGIAQIDLLIHTHAHADHIGSSAYVIDHFPIKAIFDAGFEHPTDDYIMLLEKIQQKGIPMKIARKGKKIEVLPDLSMVILAPMDPLIKGSRSDVNANSIVLKLTYKDQSFLLTGDAELETEERLLKDPHLLKADLLKVAHHGSRHASSEAFLDQVQPKLAMISCSESNSFGHPAEETIKKFKDRGIDTAVTADLGTIMILSNGKKWQVFSDQSMLQEKRKGKEKKNKKTKEEQEREEYDQDLIDLNKANRIQLQSLIGVGEKTVELILEYRKRTRFEKPQDLMEIKGIEEKKYQALKHQLKSIDGINP
jgi:competence protein ComEC